MFLGHDVPPCHKLVPPVDFDHSRSLELCFLKPASLDNQIKNLEEQLAVISKEFEKLAEQNRKDELQQINIWKEQTAKNKKSKYIEHLLFSRRMLVTPAGRVYMLFNKTKEGDRLVGSGAYKKVKIAEDYFTKQKFASASMEIDSTANDELHNLFLLSNVEGFVRLHDYVDYVSKKSQMAKRRLILDLGDDGNLHSYLCDKLSLTEKVEIVFQVVQTIARLHKKGYIHRDLKPGNIFLKKSQEKDSKDKHAHFQVLIGDVGSVVLKDDDFQKRNIQRTTTWYCPHEFALHKVKGWPLVSVTTEKLDIWSIGCIVYQLFCNVNLPWVGKNDAETFENIMNWQGLKGDEVIKDNSKIQELLERAFELSPWKRASASELLAILKRG